MNIYQVAKSRNSYYHANTQEKIKTKIILLDEKINGYAFLAKKNVTKVVKSVVNNELQILRFFLLDCHPKACLIYQIVMFYVKTYSFQKAWLSKHWTKNAWKYREKGLRYDINFFTCKMKYINEIQVIPLPSANGILKFGFCRDWELSSQLLEKRQNKQKACLNVFF